MVTLAVCRAAWSLETVSGLLFSSRSEIGLSARQGHIGCNFIMPGAPLPGGLCAPFHPLSEEARMGNFEVSRNQKIVCAAFLFLPILAACLLSFTDGSDRQNSAVRLADGRWLQVEAVSFGRVHEFQMGSKLVAMLQGWLPRGWLGPRLPRSVTKTDRECLMVFCTLNPPPQGLLSAGFRVVSDSGETFAAKWGSSHYSDGSVVIKPMVYEFPRQDPSFMLTGTINDMPVAIRIKNPLYEQPSPD